jgi:hypothetical protein
VQIDLEKEDQDHLISPERVARSRRRGRTSLHRRSPVQLMEASWLLKRASGSAASSNDTAAKRSILAFVER